MLLKAMKEDEGGSQRPSIQGKELECEGSCEVAGVVCTKPSARGSSGSHQAIMGLEPQKVCKESQERTNTECMCVRYRLSWQ